MIQVLFCWCVVQCNQTNSGIAEGLGSWAARKEPPCGEQENKSKTSEKTAITFVHWIWNEGREEVIAVTACFVIRGEKHSMKQRVMWQRLLLRTTPSHMTASDRGK